MNPSPNPIPPTNPDPDLPGLAAVRRAAGVVGAVAQLVGNVLGNVERLVTDAVVDSTAVAKEAEALYAAAARGAAAVSAAIRATPRFTRLVRELLRLMLAYRIHAIKASSISDEDAQRALQVLHEKSAQRLYTLCIELRGGVLKVGQFASSRMDLLPAPYIESLSRLQDRVPAVAAEAITARVEQELGAPLDELFASFDPVPLAAASLAQVHAAVLKGPESTPVAVKVQVPEIEDVVEIDLAALRVMAGVLQDLLVPHLDLRTVAGELERSIIKELDYEREARVAGELAHNFEGHPAVRVPRVYEALSTRRVLTMELIEGQRLVAFLDTCEAEGHDQSRDQLFATLLQATCAQVLEHGLFQADPHPGNFLVLAGSRPTLALLDFGAVTRFPVELRRAYAELAGAILARDGERVADRLRQLGFRTHSGSEETLLRFADMVMDLFRPDPTVSLADFDPKAAFEEALTLARANPVQVPRDFVLLGRVFAALGGLLLRYRPEINLFALVAPHLAQVMATPKG